jgi:hypothetical protein
MPSPGPPVAMRVKVKVWALPDLLSTMDGKDETEIAFDGTTVGELLRNLFGRIDPGKREAYLNDQGEFIRGLVIVHNGKALPDLGKFGHILGDGDSVGVALTYG